MVNQNTYRQPGAPHGWRGRWMRRFGMDVATTPLTKGALTVPNWMTGKAMVFFFVTMIVCWGAFGHVPEFELWIVASITVVLFFYGSESMSKSLERKKEKTFLKNIFLIGLAMRLIWMLYCYLYFNMEHFGNTNGDNTDSLWYMSYGDALAKWIGSGFEGSLSDLRKFWMAGIDDTGYPMWLGILGYITGTTEGVFIPMLIKCFFSAYSSISIYNIAKRHYGDGTARMAAIFMCVNPNMIFWCGNMFKEIEMVFLVCVAIDNFDRVLTSGKRFTFKNLLPGFLAATALMFFRSVLGIVVFLAVFAHIVMASQRVMSTGKKIIAGVLVATVLAASMGDRIRTQSKELLESAQSTERQEKNLNFRASREGGNSFARYAGTAVFAPLIFTIPFPTFNSAQEGQIAQVQLSGGSYIKNIFSFFVLIVMFMMLISGEWRNHVFILAYTLGYHVVLVMSNFAHSGRFHMPVWPMIMLFAAYGIQIAKSNAKIRKWFPTALVVEVLICIAWNWFKLKGRGEI